MQAETGDRWLWAAGVNTEARKAGVVSPVPWFGYLRYEWLEEWDATYDGESGFSHAAHWETGQRELEK